MQWQDRLTEKVILKLQKHSKDMLLKKLTMLQDLQNFLVKLLQIQLREILNYVQKQNSALATVR